MRHTVTPQQMREIEERAFAAGVEPIELMERAAAAAADALLELTGDQRASAAFFCGRGNNGGDGLAAARLWAERGGRALIVMRGEPRTANARLNFERARQRGIEVLSSAPKGVRFDAAVDALVGIGLGGEPLSRELEEGIASMNALGCPVLAVDIPSGMNALTGACRGGCVRADMTVSFGWAKTGHLISPRAELTGRLKVVDIGLASFAQGMDLAENLEDADLPRRLPQRPVTAHKGSCGRVLLCCGSLGMAGAAAMAALGCLRAGAGLAYIACEEEIIPILQVLVPNALCLPVGRAVREQPARDVLLAGCGLGRSEAARHSLLSLYQPDVPAVLDADALNLLSETPFPLGSRTVITPHVGEAARLLGSSPEAVADDLLGAARGLWERFGCTVALKSHASVILDGKRLAIHSLGSPALAKGGSGDALAGIIAGLMAQGMDGFEAARVGCLWHGKAARVAQRRMGPLSPLTGEILALMGEASLEEAD